MSPSVVAIPRGQKPLGSWPAFEKDPAAGHATLTVVYTVGPEGMRASGGIQVGLGYQTGDTRTPVLAVNGGYALGPTDSMSKFPVGQLQCAAPKEANYVTARASTQDPLVVKIKPRAGGEKVAWVRTSKALAAGDVITLVLGDTALGGPGVALSWHPGRPQVCVLEDATGDGNYTLSKAEMPSVLFGATSAERFLVEAPITVRVGEPFAFAVHAMQGEDNPSDRPFRTVPTWQGILRFESDDPSATLPAEQTLERADLGTRRFEAAFRGLGRHMIKVTDASAPALAGSSNTVVVLAADDPRAICCGDLQRHSCQGGHAAIPDPLVWQELWQHAFDFGSVIQHSWNHLAAWDAANRAAQEFQRATDPHETAFVAFPAYEWTLGGAHRHVVYRSFTTAESNPAFTDRAYLGFEQPAPQLVKDAQGFLDALERQGGVDHFAIVHHTLWSFDSPDAPFEWGRERDAAVQPLVEIFSTHGSSEAWLESANAPADYPIGGALSEQRARSNLASVRDAFALGYRFGVIASSDRHAAELTCTTKGSGEDYVRTGLACVVTSRSNPSLRDRVWTALRTRRTYATTGARIYLDFTTADGAPMGAEVSSPAVKLRFEAAASGIATPSRPTFTRASILRDDTVVAERPETKPDLQETWSDPAPLRDGRAHAYWLKLQQSDDHLAWSTPIWIRVE